MNLATIPFRASPHFSPRGKPITAVVLHDTGGKTAEGSLTWFENPESKVSAHFVIDRDGTVFQCVDVARASWHAGSSVLHGEANVNSFSVGIELVDESDDPYPAPQLAAAEDLVATLIQHYAIPLHRVVGHQHICVPAGRKVDPGIDFPWYMFLLAVARAVENA